MTAAQFLFWFATNSHLHDDYIDEKLGEMEDAETEKLENAASKLNKALVGQMPAIGN